MTLSLSGLIFSRKYSPDNKHKKWPYEIITNRELQYDPNDVKHIQKIKEIYSLPIQ